MVNLSWRLALMGWKWAEMEWREAEKLSSSTSAGFQEMVRPPKAPEESTEMDWLPRQSLDMRVSRLVLLDLVFCNMRIIGLSYWIFLLIILYFKFTCEQAVGHIWLENNQIEFAEFRITKPSLITVISQRNFITISHSIESIRFNNRDIIIEVCMYCIFFNEIKINIFYCIK